MLEKNQESRSSDAAITRQLELVTSEVVGTQGKPIDPDPVDVLPPAPVVSGPIGDSGESADTAAKINPILKLGPKDSGLALEIWKEANEKAA